MKFSKFAAFAAICATMLLASCGKEVDPSDPDNGGNGGNGGDTPAETVVADVLFSVENGDYCYFVAPQVAGEAAIKVIRSGNEKADSYTIKVNDASEGLGIPEKVEFAEGASEATIKITAPAGAAYDKYDFFIELTGDNVNAKASSEAGTLKCEGTVYVYEESYAVLSFGGTNQASWKYLGNIKQKAWRAADNKIVLKEFLGEAADLSITYSSDWTSGYGYNIDEISYNDEHFTQYDAGYDDGTYFAYFANPISDDNWEYASFAPKGDKRYIYTLGFYLGSNYSSYYKTEDNDYLYFTTFVDFYGEEEGIDKGFSWLYYMYVTFVAEENLSKYDFVNFPELVTADTKELKFTLTDYSDDDIDLDTQTAKVVKTETGTDYVIEDFFNSGAPLTLHTFDGSYQLTFEPATWDGGQSYYYENNFYFVDGDGYDIYFQPADNMWACFEFTHTDDYSEDWTCFWYEDGGYAYIECSAYIYGQQEDFVDGCFLYIEF